MKTINYPFFPFIDSHIHVMPAKMLPKFFLDAIRQETKGLIDFEKGEDPNVFLEFLDQNQVKRAWLINYVSSIHKVGFEINEWTANYASTDPDRLIPFGSIDFVNSKDPETDLERMRDLGIKGVKFHGPHIWLDPAAHFLGTHGGEALQITYERLERWGMPLMVHTGTSVIPGARNRFGNPLSVEDIALDFPSLKIIIAHAGRPLWGKEAAFVLRRFPNTYLDVSSIPPKKFKEFVPGFQKFQDRLIYGSDFPGFGTKPPIVNALWYAQSDLFTEEAKHNMFRRNAEKLIS